MANPKYSHLPSPDTNEVVTRQFFAIKRVLDYVCGRHDYDRTLLSGLELEVAYVNKVRHGLGAAPTGWRVTARSAPAFIYEDEDSTDDYELYLISSGDVTIDLEVW